MKNTLLLLTEGCTIPFIARYRKDSTQNLDEVAIEHIAKSQADYDCPSSDGRVYRSQYENLPLTAMLTAAS